MPGVTKDGKVAESYGYDVGGKTVPIKADESEETAGHKFPPGGYQGGNLGKLDKLNTDRFYERPAQSEVAKTMAKTGYEATEFDKDGNVKGGPSSDVNFLQKDGSWAPAEGRDAVGKKSMAPGGGGRFQAMVDSGKSPALAAYIGRKKYGAKKMAQFSAAGRKRS
jgi:hypothetical protein